MSYKTILVSLNEVGRLSELVAAAGLDHPAQLRPEHVFRRVTAQDVASFAALYPTLQPGELLDGTTDERFRDAWAMARPDSFAPGTGVFEAA